MPMIPTVIPTKIRKIETMTHIFSFFVRIREENGRNSDSLFEIKG